jgi:hypothetical protein
MPMPAASPAFKAYMERLLRERFGGVKSRMAEAAGVTPSPFWRNVEEGRFGTNACLRLAMYMGESPRTLLELTGKRETADLIERAYGHERHPLGELDRALIALPNSVKRSLLQVVRATATESPPAEPRATKGNRARSA